MELRIFIIFILGLATFALAKDNDTKITYTVLAAGDNPQVGISIDEKGRIVKTSIIDVKMTTPAKGKSGNGRIESVDGIVYEGDYEDGQPSGKGKLTFPSGSSLVMREGEFYYTHVARWQEI